MNCIKKIANVFVLFCMTAGTAWGMDIFQAARTGNIGRIEELLASGADINQQDHDGMTPLHWAARNWHDAVVDKFIGAKANVNRQDRWGRIPLHLTIHNRCEVVALKLIEAGSHVNQQDIDGWTPLLRAVQYGHEQTVLRLIEARADVNKQHNNNGWTPLHNAVFLGYERVVASLIAAGADINRRTYKGKTALDLAQYYQQHTTVALLNDYNQRIEQARQRASVIAYTLAFATRASLSPLASLPQDLLRYITHLVAQAEEVDARRPR